MKTIGGWLLIALSAFMLLGFLNSTSSPSIATQIFTFLIVILLPFGAGVSILRSQSQTRKKLSLSKQELAHKTLDSELLRFAAKQDGKLTVIEVAAQFALSTSEAEEVLDQLAQRGLADYEVTDSGLMVYVFNDIRHLDEKKQSKRVLDA